MVEQWNSPYITAWQYFPYNF